MNLKSVSLVVLLAVVFACGWFASAVFAPREKVREERAATVPSVRVDVAKAEPFNPPKTYVGHVEPVQETDILPHVEGYIAKVAFVEGATVKAGDILFEIDDEQYRASLNLRKSELNSARAKKLVASAEVDRAERYNRRLTEADDRGVTGTDRDTAETTLASAKAALNSAEAAVAQAEAALAIAEFNMKHTIVKAPLSGRIGKAFHHVGDYVSPSKSPLARIVQTDPVRVVFPVTDRDWAGWRKAAEGAQAAQPRLRVVLPDGTFYDKFGHIDFGDNEMNRETASVVIRASFANPANALMANAFVKVVADADKPPTVTAVPTSALVREADGWAVWTLGAGDRAERRGVSVGAAWKGMTAIREGLRIGERVVTEGIHKVVAGQPVKVVAP